MADPDPQGGVWAALGVVLAWLGSRVWPAIRSLGPRAIDAVSGRRERAAAASKIEAEAESTRQAVAPTVRERNAAAAKLEAEAKSTNITSDLALLSHYETALAKAEEREAARDKREIQREAQLNALVKLESDCRELHKEAAARADLNEAALKRTEGQVKDLLRTVTALAVRVGGTPPAGHSTITAPLDPLADPRDSRADPASMTTPPAGHRLAAPSVPRDDPEPTPDLHASVTPRGE